MAPTPAVADSVFPLITIFSHLGLSVGLIALIYHSLNTARKVLPPSAGVRNRAHFRHDHIKLLLGLAGVSLLLASYFTVTYASHSYMLWAYSHRHSFRKHYPPLLFGYHGAFGKKEMYHWIAESSIYTDLLRVPVLTARNYWWASALDLSAVPWALFLSIVGKKRKIQHLWAYAALSQLVGLSYAQALFFIALHLTPVPLPDNAREMTHKHQPRVMTRLEKLRKRAKNKPENWTPSPLVYLASISLSYLAIFLTPIASDTTTFIPVTALARVLPFAPMLIPYLVPESWGTVHPAGRDTRYTNLFRAASLISFLLYAKATYFAITLNDPGAQHHPSLLHPLDFNHIDSLERTSTTAGRILGAAFSSRGSNPLMGKIGWDVLLSGLMIGAWAMIRGTEPNGILHNMGLMGVDSHAALGHVDDMAPVIDTAKELADDAMSAITSSAKTVESKLADKTDREIRKSTRGKKSYAEAVKDKDDKPKSRKTQGKRTMTEREDDKAYVPDNDEDVVMGEEETGELETESAALIWGLAAVAGLGSVTSGVLGAESGRV